LAAAANTVGGAGRSLRAAIAVPRSRLVDGE
jgi:hypothetical protein